MKKTLFLILFSLNFILLRAQSDTTNILNNLLEDLLEESTIDVEDSQLYDLFEELIENPVNVNMASLEVLTQIPFMNFETAEIIIGNRNKYGQFFTIDDIYKIENIDTEILNKVRFFITTTSIKPNTESSQSVFWNNVKINFRSRIISDIQERKGFKENKYFGSRIKNYNRLKIISPDLVSINLLTDKDPGEKSYNDFYSGHVSFSNIFVFNKIVFGDYLFEFGQGLALWSPYSISKGGEAVKSVIRKPKGIKPYTSSSEAGYFRGGAISFLISKFNFSFFYSKRKIDATIEDQKISTILFGGYHRTENELEKKQNAEEIIAGGSINFTPFKNTLISVLNYNVNYGKPLRRKSPFEKSSSKYSFWSLSYSYSSKLFLLYGETAFNGVSTASINNFEFSFSKMLQFITSVRSYPRNYSNLFSNGFGERSGTQNEFGIYTGIRFRSAAGLFNLYFDQFKFPVSASGNPLPASGNEFLFDYFSRPFSKTELRIRYKNERKEIAEIDENNEIITDQIKNQIRLELIVYPSKNIRLKTRIEKSYYDLSYINHSEEGILISQDFRIKINNATTIASRFTFFDTDSYNSRIYLFENDLKGVLTNSALFGKGVRWYLLASHKFFNLLTLSFKYAETFKPDAEFLSSGLNEIKGGLDNRFSLQLDLNF